MSETPDYEWLIDTIERYSAEFANNSALDLNAWLDANSPAQHRAEVLYSLLLVETEQTGWDLVRLKSRLEAFAGQLNHPKYTVKELLRQVAADAIECGASSQVLWSLLEKFGFPADELQIAAPGDPCYLGQCLLGRYRLEQRVGHGRFGVVYRAVDQHTGSDVAVKALRVVPVLKETALRLMQEEVLVLQQLNVAGIPKLVAVSLATEPPFFVMEFVHGKCLRSCLQNETFSLERSLTLIRDLANVVHATHLQKLIHRDLKPENLLLTANDRVFVVDFGISLRETVQFGRTPPDRVGSYAYMAPEALVGLGRQLDARTDVYSLGIILYEMLTGICPVDDTTKEDALVTALVSARKLSLPDSIPKSVGEIILKCIQNEPFERFDSAADFAAAVDSALKECCPQGGQSEDLSDSVPDRIPLIAWRSGMRMGRCLECHITYTHHLRLLSNTWQSTQSPQACHKVMRDVLGYLQWTIISHQELMQLIGQIGTAILTFPRAEEYRTMFYRSRAEPSAEQIENLIQQRSEIDQTLDQTFVAVQLAFASAANRCAILFELACRLVTDKRSRDDLPELIKLYSSSQLPEQLWQEYMAVRESNVPVADLEIALQKLDREVERYLQS